MLKFDGLSILLIGLIGTVGLGLAAFEQSGALDEFRHFLRSEERLLEAPALQREVGPDVQRIVIRTDGGGYWPIYADAVDARELSVSAFVRASFLPGERDPSWLASLLSEERVGDTLYVTVRRPPASNGLDEAPSRFDVRVVAPKDVKVEFHTLAHELELRNKPEKWEVPTER
ncbi:hypothetical protein [Cohnella faecalis]|uniref:Uncharacterized protein n=1 Tax=Cohnella faecalis TaxID=2315694 RepID=A0A398CRQ7_9BACL|nr:hypothetical protein [Cohnella faecalis]RIE02051.1 hypothetical protein D3H35_14905 [Cohnella faecalis]